MRGGRRRARSSLSLMMALASLLALLTLGVQMAEGVLNCYTGDKSILRSKRCYPLGNRESDVCFKKISDAVSEVLRGCFSLEMATLITNQSSFGCHPIPEKYGTGTLCVCDQDLCNDASSTRFKPLLLLTTLLLLVLNNVLLALIS